MSDQPDGPQPVKVLFKHEDQMDGRPIGPMRLMFSDDDEDTSRPYDPTRPRDEWVFLDHAQKMADTLGVPLEER